MTNKRNKIATVAAILYNPRGQVLLQQRDDKPGIHHPGFWTLWGGRVEDGETPEQAIRRELSEELDLVDVPLAWWYMYERPWQEGVTIEQHVFTAPFDRPAESLTLYEGQALGYFTRAEIKNLPVAFVFHEVLESFFESGLAQINQDPRAIWDARYVRYATASGLPYEPWLERWLPEIERACRRAHTRRILDLGCGRGSDSRYLASNGFLPVAADYSFAALRLGREQGIPADWVNLDLRHGLPFSGNVFCAVVANLSLHYFSWQQTRAILGQVRGCLVQDGLLLAGFNSVRDANYGASGWPEIEPHAYLVDGMYKRFFDRPELEKLFADGWQTLHLEERTIPRYGEPKVIWEIVSRRK